MMIFVCDRVDSVFKSCLCFSVVKTWDCVVKGKIDLSLRDK